MNVVCNMVANSLRPQCAKGCCQFLVLQQVFSEKKFSFVILIFIITRMCWNGTPEIIMKHKNYKHIVVTEHNQQVFRVSFS